MHSQKLFSLAAILPLTIAGNLVARQDCSSDFRICNPPGARDSTLGPIGPRWANLYSEIVNLVNGYSLNDNPSTSTVDPDGPARRDIGFCCSDVADCLLVPEYNCPMCWDQFTTNVAFADGTVGTVVTGVFNTSRGDVINLVYGDYVLRDGTRGNIYDGATESSMKSDHNTLSTPMPFTSSGLGSAIPATGLGTMAELTTATTVFPATTEPASTGDSITLIGTMTGCGNCPPYSTTIPGSTEPGTTRSASTTTFISGIITPTMFASDAASARVGYPVLPALIVSFMALII